jgi:hypothetical protein
MRERAIQNLVGCWKEAICLRIGLAFFFLCGTGPPRFFLSVYGVPHGPIVGGPLVPDGLQYVAVTFFYID